MMKEVHGTYIETAAQASTKGANNRKEQTIKKNVFSMVSRGFERFNCN